MLRRSRNVVLTLMGTTALAGCAPEPAGSPVEIPSAAASPQERQSSTTVSENASIPTSAVETDHFSHVAVESGDWTAHAGDAQEEPLAANTAAPASSSGHPSVRPHSFWWFPLFLGLGIVRQPGGESTRCCSRFRRGVQQRQLPHHPDQFSARALAGTGHATSGGS